MLQGLLHITDMSWDHVGMPEDVVSPGDVIQCKIKGVDKDKKRIFFSLKLMEVGVVLAIRHWLQVARV